MNCLDNAKAEDKKKKSWWILFAYSDILLVAVFFSFSENENKACR